MPGATLNCKGGAYARGDLKLQGGRLSVEAGMIRMVTTALPITVRGSEKWQRMFWGDCYWRDTYVLG